MQRKAAILLTSLLVPAAALAQQPPASPNAPATAQPQQAPVEPAPQANAPLGNGITLPPVDIKQAAPKQIPPATKATTAPRQRASAPPATVVTAPPSSQTAAPNVGPAVAPSAFGGTAVEMSPVGGAAIPLEKVPGAVATISAPDIARNSSTSLQDALATSVPGITITDAQGNAFQTDVQYRGFAASPVLGTSQGLAIYQNGVRINEVWGDTVNWDALPTNAIKSVTVVGNNPVYGLNAIGGAIGIAMKDGYSFQGNEVDMRFGSFGRRQIGVQSGGNSSGHAGYVAFEAVGDAGYRDFSHSTLRRLYADYGFKTDSAELHLNFTGAVNTYGVAAASPIELLRQGWARTFTTPQTTRNEVEMFSANGAVAVTDTFKLSGNAYVRRYSQRHVDGNISDIEDCGGVLCLDGTPINGGGIATPSGPIGSIDRTSLTADSYGASLQGVEKSRVFGMGNQLVLGGSYDHGGVGYKSSSELGIIGSSFILTGTGVIVSSPKDLAPRSLRGTTDYTGLFILDTLDLTDRLSLTAGGRYNVAQIKLADRTGEFPDLTGDHTYSRFNPMAGATFKLVPGMSIYGGWSQANRAPTPVELACSNPAQPCIIESFLTSDPPLKQVVSTTVESGLRGESSSWARNGTLTWSLGLFRTQNQDDILPIASPLTGRGFFTNAGETQRQGFETAVKWREERFQLSASYSYVDATFRNAQELSSPNNPSAGPCSADPAQKCINVRPGDQLPGIPVHRFKAGFDYWLTPEWMLGADLNVTSQQVYRGDEANQNARLAGYTRVDLRSSYDLNRNFQIYGVIQNLFDQRYGLSGTYFNLDAANTAGAPSGITFADPRTMTPAQPFAAYGGIKFRW